MEKLKFKCTLESDVVLSASPATQGGGKTLDFIPGNAFLGIAASSLYDKENDHTWRLFHSGHVRFGDAHPSAEGRRGLHIPAALFYPKLTSISEDCYVRYKTPETEEVKEMQLKQCRSGYYVFDDKAHTAAHVRTGMSVAIKSAYDARLRRSKDEQMFTYQALRKGLVMYFEVELDPEAASCRDELVNALSGLRHVGKSRSAEYGLVSIKREDFPEPVTHRGDKGGKRYVAVYAEGRLIFLDGNGRPTFQPDVTALGFDKGEICWDKSQIRSFQYAPWNYKRQAFGNDRCGIEKGSVFIVRTDDPVPEDGYVGVYRSEGFGKVLYDPAFLESQNDGHSRYSFGTEAAADPEQDAEAAQQIQPCDSSLLSYLETRSTLADSDNDVMRDVNAFVEQNKKRFLHGGESFAAQWGTIRNLAMCITDNNKALHDEVIGFLTHGVAKGKWEDRGRLRSLMEFMEQEPGILKENLQEVLVNLSAEMAKICSSNRSCDSKE